MNHNLAELALETRLAARETAERRPNSAAQLAFACKLGSIDASLYRAELEMIAAQIGLSADATGHVLGQWEYRARLLDEASERLRALIPFEAQIERMISSQDAAAAGLVSRSPAAIRLRAVGSETSSST